MSKPRLSPATITQFQFQPAWPDVLRCHIPRVAADCVASGAGRTQDAWGPAEAKGAALCPCPCSQGPRFSPPGAGVRGDRHDRERPSPHAEPLAEACRWPSGNNGLASCVCQFPRCQCSSRSQGRTAAAPRMRSVSRQRTAAAPGTRKVLGREAAVALLLIPLTGRRQDFVFGAVEQQVHRFPADEQVSLAGPRAHTGVTRSADVREGRSHEKGGTSSEPRAGGTRRRLPGTQHPPVWPHNWGASGPPPSTGVRCCVLGDSGLRHSCGSLRTPHPSLKTIPRPFAFKVPPTSGRPHVHVCSRGAPGRPCGSLPQDHPVPG